MEPEINPQPPLPPSQETPPVPPETPAITPPHIRKKRVFTDILIILSILVVILGGAYYFWFQNRKATPATQTKITTKITPHKIAVSPAPSIPAYTNITVSREAISTSPGPSSSPISNKAEIGQDKTVLLSPDKTKIATYYDTAPKIGEGVPDFNSVDILDKTSGKTVTYHLSGPIIYASYSLFWSPVDNRVYFTHASNGIDNYALWSSKPNGTDAKLISGAADADLGSSKNLNLQALDKSAIYGASWDDFSPDGKMIATIRYFPIGSSKQTIWIMNYDGTNSHEIPIQGSYSNLNTISWKPDGQNLVITDLSGTKYEIGLSGGTLTKIAS